MFMRANRAKNGASQPEEIASREAPTQAAQKSLIPNPGDFGRPDNRLFEPDMSTLEQINRMHYRGGLDEGDEKPYENMIPYGHTMP